MLKKLHWHDKNIHRQQVKCFRIGQEQRIHNDWKRRLEWAKGRMRHHHNETLIGLMHIHDDPGIIHMKLMEDFSSLSMTLPRTML